jgi:hypothetical protein
MPGWHETPLEYVTAAVESTLMNKVGAQEITGAFSEIRNRSSAVIEAAFLNLFRACPAQAPCGMHRPRFTRIKLFATE